MSAPLRSLAPKERLASLALGLLLRRQLTSAALADVEWGLLTDLAERNAVLVRLADRLAQCGVHPPRRLAETAERERERARVALGVLELIDAAAARHDVAWLLPKARDRFPDVGDDLDLLVGADADAVDRWLLEGLAVTRHEPTLAHRLAGSTVYTVAGTSLTLDIRHGRLGHAGQHPEYAARLFRNRRTATLGSVTCAIPAPEDQIVLQGVEKVTARRSFHLSDVVQTIETMRRTPLDWDDVVGTARALGVRGALSCYLHHVDDIHTRLLGGPLLDGPTKRALGPRLSRRAVFGAAGFRFPALWITGRVHAHQLARAVVARDWPRARRLGLWPVAALAEHLGRYVPALRAAPRDHRDADWQRAAEAGAP